MIKIDFTTKPTIPKYILDSHEYKYLFDENGKLHSYNDLPAVIQPDGTKWWHKHGVLHRDNNLPSVMYSWGKKEYWENGVRIK